MPLSKIAQSVCVEVAPVPTSIEPKLKKLSDVRAVVFNVYGTLFISAAGDISVAQDSAKRSIMEDVFAAEEIIIQGDSSNLYDLFIDHLNSHRDIQKAEGIEHPEIDICDVWQDFTDELSAFEVIEADIHPITIKRLAMQYECRANPVWPMPGLIDMCEGLLDKDQTLAIVSNAQFYTPLMFTALLQNSVADLGFSEECCAWSYKEGMKKPNPSLFQKSLDALVKEENTQAHQVLYVGHDMLNDIIPAQKLGMKTALFAGDERSLQLHEDKPECKGVTPDIIITELSQIAECIED